LVPDDVLKVVSTEGPGGRTTGPFFRQWIRRVFPSDETKLSSSLAIGVEFLGPEEVTSDPGRGQKGEVDLSSIDANNFRLFVGRYSEHNLRGRETLYTSIKGDIVRDVSARTVWFVPTEPLQPSTTEGTTTWLTAYLSPRLVDADGHVLKPSVRFRGLPETHSDRYQGFLDDFTWRFQTNELSFTRQQPQLSGSVPVRNAFGSTQPISQEVDNRLVIDPTLARLVTAAVNLGFDRERVYACLRARPTTQINVLFSNLKSGVGAPLSSSSSVSASSMNSALPPIESLHISTVSRNPQTNEASFLFNPCSVDPEVLARQQKKLLAIEESNSSVSVTSTKSLVSPTTTSTNLPLTSSGAQVR